jgi:hypothetical protein
VSGASQFGLTGIPVTPNSAGLPPIDINGLQRLGTAPWRPQWQISQAWNFIDSLSWLKNTHSFKFGYQYLRRSDNFLDIEAPQGWMLALGTFTSGNSFGLPDFLLGDMNWAIFTTPLVVHYFQPGHSFYGMDSWRTTPKLTLTYGLRYELFSPILDRENQTANFSPANGGQIITAPPNASGWAARSLINPDKNDFAPRVGFAYRMTDRLVLRGGYGVFYQHWNRIGAESLIQLNFPFLINGNTATFGGNTPIFQLKNGFPINRFTPSIVTLPSLQIRAQDPNQQSSYIEQTSFGPEFQLANDMVFALSYVGNWGRKMNRLRDANQGLITGFDASGCPTVSFPYPNLNTVSPESGCGFSGQHAFLELATNDGNTSYNALEASLRRNFARGLGFSVNYTWGHSLANFGDNLTGSTFPQNGYQYGNEKSNSILDIEQRFVSNIVWALPVGEGQRFLSDNGWVSRRLLGGWRFNGIATFQTGSPFEVDAPDSSFTGANHASYANCIGNPFSGATDDPKLYTTTGFFINYNAFSAPGNGHFGTCAPRTYHGPGIGLADLSLFKEIKLSESKRLEFRSEFFNALNHPNFANPSSFYTPFAPGGFGKVSNTIAPILGQGSGGPGDPREIQFALKLYF